MELFATAAISVSWAGGDASDNFTNLFIQNNEIMFPTSPVPFGVIALNPPVTGASPWLYNVEIQHNSIGGFTSGANVLVNASSGYAVDISHNIMSSGVTGTLAIFMSSGVSGCTVGPNLTIGPGSVPNTGFEASTITPTCSPLVAPY
jgi:hypothetical protein